MHRRQAILTLPRLLWTCLSGGVTPTSPPCCYSTSLPRHNSVHERVSQKLETGCNGGEGDVAGLNLSSDLALQRLVTSLSAEQQTVLLNELHRIQAETARKAAEGNNLVTYKLVMLCHCCKVRYLCFTSCSLVYYPLVFCDKTDY